MKPRQRFQVGNEINSGMSRVTDLRQVRVMSKPMIKAIGRVASPPVKLSTDPIRITKVHGKGYVDSLAYDFLFITAATAVATLSSFISWFFLGYLIVAVAFKISSQRIFGSALFCLILIPILSIINKQGAADDFAIFTFFFLAIGLVRAIIELRSEKTNVKNFTA